MGAFLNQSKIAKLKYMVKKDFAEIDCPIIQANIKQIINDTNETIGIGYKIDKIAKIARDVEDKFGHCIDEYYIIDSFFWRYFNWMNQSVYKDYEPVTFVYGYGWNI